MLRSLERACHNNVFCHDLMGTSLMRLHRRIDVVEIRRREAALRTDEARCQLDDWCVHRYTGPRRDFGGRHHVARIPAVPTARLKLVAIFCARGERHLSPSTILWEAVPEGTRTPSCRVFGIRQGGLVDCLAVRQSRRRRLLGCLATCLEENPHSI